MRIPRCTRRCGVGRCISRTMLPSTGSARTRSAPNSAKHPAVVRPIPLAAPTTNARRPSRLSPSGSRRCVFEAPIMEVFPHYQTSDYGSDTGPRPGVSSRIREGPASASTDGSVRHAPDLQFRETNNLSTWARTASPRTRCHSHRAMAMIQSSFHSRMAITILVL